MNEFEYRGENKETKKNLCKCTPPPAPQTPPKAPPPPPKPPIKPPPKPPAPKIPPKKKFDLKKKKDNTVKSLFEIEHFLRDFKQVAKGIKLYNVFKW